MRFDANDLYTIITFIVLFVKICFTFVPMFAVFL